MAARPSRRAAAFARAALLAFAAALMRHVPAAVLSRAAPAVLGRADESSPGLLLQPLRGGGPAAEGRDDSADLSLQVASSSMKLPRRSLERLRAPDELNAARITLARPARRDVGLPGAASGVATSQAVPPAVPLTAPPFSVPPQLSAPPPPSARLPPPPHAFEVCAPELESPWELEPPWERGVMGRLWLTARAYGSEGGAVLGGGGADILLSARTSIRTWVMATAPLDGASCISRDLAS